MKRIIYIITSIVICSMLWSCNGAEIKELEKRISDNEQRINEIDKENLKLQASIGNLDIQIALKNNIMAEILREEERANKFVLFRTSEEKKAELAIIKDRYYQVRYEESEMLQEVYELRQKVNNNEKVIEKIKNENSTLRSRLSNLK